MTNPPTYPARPVSGGRLNRRPRLGEWAFEPKYNGWRALIRTSDGSMFNRHNEPLTIAGEYAAALKQLRFRDLEWLDCEVLGRRHKAGKGSIIVLDVVGPGSYLDRRKMLAHYFSVIPWRSRLAEGTVGLVQSMVFRAPPPDEFDVWEAMQKFNRELGCEFYEGFVAKRTDTPYPKQLFSPDNATTFWVKHRWD